MVRIIMSGCSGRMGKVITDIVANDSDAEIVAGIDVVDDGTLGYPVFKSAADINVEADVIIDFSSPKVLDALLTYATEKNNMIYQNIAGINTLEKRFLMNCEIEYSLFKSNAPLSMKNNGTPILEIAR